MMGVLTWLRAPIDAIGVFTQAKSFRDNVVIGSPWLNRKGLHVWRRQVAARMGARRRAALQASVSPEDAAALKRDGYLVKPDFLPPEVFAALRAEILAMQAPAREFVDGYSLTRLFPLDAASLPGLPATAAALASPAYLNLHAFVGSFRRTPRLSVQTVFSRFRDAVPDVQSHYHADTFHPTVKSWLYLTDVDESAAAFTYVPGSHLATRRRLAWERRVSITACQGQDRLTAEGSLRIAEADIRRLGYGPPRVLNAAPNTLVIADTSGFHRRGIPTGQSCRISIWAYARSNPFLPFPWPILPDPPALRGRVSRAIWAAQAWARRATPTRGWHWTAPRQADTPP